MKKKEQKRQKETYVQLQKWAAIVPEMFYLSKKRRLYMAHYKRNSGKEWTPKDFRDLKQMASENTPTRVMGLKLGRSEGAVRNAASENNISLKPTNQSPYNKRGS